MWTGWGWGPPSALASRFPACAWPAWHCHGITIILVIIIIIMSIQILVIIIRMMKILEFRKSGKELAQCSAVWLCWWTDNTVDQIIQSLSCWSFHCTSGALVLSTQCTSGALQRSQKSLANFGLSPMLASRQPNHIHSSIFVKFVPIFERPMLSKILSRDKILDRP